MVVEHTATFTRRLVADIVFFGRWVGGKIVVQMECFVGVLKHGVDRVVVATVVVDRMVSYFEMVDFGPCKWGELLLEKRTM